MADSQEQDQDPLWGNLRETAAGQPEEWGNVADHYLPKAQPSPLQRAGRGEIPQDEAIRQYIQQTTSPQAVQQVVNNVGDIATPVGNIHSAQDAIHAYQGGDWLGSALGAIGAIPVVGSIERAIPRSIDSLGYYSHALEAAKALPQAKGTPEQMLAQLKKAGVKDAELEATNTRQFLEGKKSVTRDELAQHLEDNRVTLNRQLYGAYTPEQDIAADKLLDDRSIPTRELESRVYKEVGNPTTQWSSYSLDPQNPTYRETVLHLPFEQAHNIIDNKTGKILSTHKTEDEAFEQALEMRRQGIPAEYVPSQPHFQFGHFPEPNVTGHLMTSEVRDANGRKVLNVDQIQSDWGQALRDNGARSEERIQQLRDAWKAAEAKVDEANSYMERFARDNRDHIEAATQARNQRAPWAQVRYGNRGDFDTLVEYGPSDIRQKAMAYQNLYDDADAEAKRLRAEYSTAKESAPGHPLVNTTDQWTNTTLRHALRQAVESGADAISIPRGDTVLSYNPGSKHGMNEFYNKIVPKNLGNILKKIDPKAPPSEFHERLATPTRGSVNRGQLEVEPHSVVDNEGFSQQIQPTYGFTVFPLTDKIKQSVTQKGQPLFKRGGTVRRADGGETVMPKNTTATPQYDTAIPSLSDIFAQSTAPQPLSTWDKLRALFSDQPTGYQGMRPSIGH